MSIFDLWRLDLLFAPRGGGGGDGGDGGGSGDDGNFTDDDIADSFRDSPQTQGGQNVGDFGGGGSDDGGGPSRDAGPKPRASADPTFDLQPGADFTPDPQKEGIGDGSGGSRSMVAPDNKQKKATAAGDKRRTLAEKAVESGSSLVGGLLGGTPGSLIGTGVGSLVSAQMAKNRRGPDQTLGPDGEDLTATLDNAEDGIDFGGGSDNVNEPSIAAPQVLQPIITPEEQNAIEPDEEEEEEPSIFNRNRTFLAGNLKGRAPVRRRTLLRG